MVAQSVRADTHAAYRMYFLLAVSFCTNTDYKPWVRHTKQLTDHIIRPQLECIVQIGPTSLDEYLYFSYRCQDFTFAATLSMSTISNGTSSLSAIEIILSCSICQDTLSNIYAEDDENRGLRKSNDPEDGRVTKLWLTECAHLCCGKHFERGGKLISDTTYFRPVFEI